jgi:glycine cleavage system H protein
MKYTKEHEWIRQEGNLAVVGVSNHAQEALGDVVFVELPVPGFLSAGSECAVVESVKAASEVYMPIDGEVIEVNDMLTDEPSLVNEDAEGAGWFFKMIPASWDDLDDLMDEDEYKDYLD